MTAFISGHIHRVITTAIQYKKTTSNMPHICKNKNNNIKMSMTKEFVLINVFYIQTNM